MTNDEVEDLKKKLDHIERKTAIWRSQVMVLLLVFLAGWIASFFWMKGHLEARAGKTEKAFAEGRKTVEAENFVVRDASGKKLASFGVATGAGKVSSFHENFQAGSACLEIYDRTGVGRVDLGGRGLALFGPDEGLNLWLLSGDKAWGLAVNGPDKKESSFFVNVTDGKYSFYSAKPPDKNDTIVELAGAKAERVTP